MIWDSYVLQIWHCDILWLYQGRWSWLSCCGDALAEIPKIRWFGIGGDYNVLVCDLSGWSLEDLFNFCSRKLSLKTMLMVADQLAGYLQQFLYFYLNPVMINSFIHFWWPGCPKIVWHFLGSGSSCNFSLLKFYANPCREIWGLNFSIWTGKVVGLKCYFPYRSTGWNMFTQKISFTKILNLITLWWGLWGEQIRLHWLKYQIKHGPSVIFSPIIWVGIRMGVWAARWAHSC
jgi:hypothetical protein